MLLRNLELYIPCLLLAAWLQLHEEGRDCFSNLCLCLCMYMFNINWSGQWKLNGRKRILAPWHFHHQWPNPVPHLKDLRILDSFFKSPKAQCPETHACDHSCHRANDWSGESLWFIKTNQFSSRRELRSMRPLRFWVCRVAHQCRYNWSNADKKKYSYSLEVV